MTEDEKEELIWHLWLEFVASVDGAADAATKYGFIAGARAALYEIGQPTARTKQT